MQREERGRRNQNLPPMKVVHGPKRAGGVRKYDHRWSALRAGASAPGLAAPQVPPPPPSLFRVQPPARLAVASARRRRGEEESTKRSMPPGPDTASACKEVEALKAKVDRMRRGRCLRQAHRFYPTVAGEGGPAARRRATAQLGEREGAASEGRREACNLSAHG